MKTTRSSMPNWSMKSPTSRITTRPSRHLADRSRYRKGSRETMMPLRETSNALLSCLAWRALRARKGVICGLDSIVHKVHATLWPMFSAIMDNRTTQWRGLPAGGSMPVGFGRIHRDADVAATRAITNSQAHAHALADALGVVGHDRSGVFAHDFGHGLVPQLQPAREMLAADRQRLVLGQRVAAVGAGAQRHRTPEPRQQALVCVPVVDGGIEHRPDQVVGADLVVETVDQRGDMRLVERVDVRACLQWYGHGPRIRLCVGARH